ncbi:MAG: DUF1549 and DUF1553 domain-containing protein [Pirellulales bacterium]|nr:MAG: DUF1553 domain-containing protein [Phycisphaeraceae bacterium]HAU48031.1 hypothetical protein [Planctomycetaceae bacterium]|tara:strand:+ start:3539 stop:5569 length:2031 start_codon:yes stop_codon:yes gene_type:complete
MVGQSHFLRQRLFSVSLCIGIALLNGSAWSAKPEPETEWKPPKLPEAVTIKPEGAVLKVAPIDRETRPEIEQAAAQIDSILQAYWNENKTKSGKKTTDHEFVRRAYLELAGRIPTIDEARTFCNATGRKKRGQLIDDLLESPGYVSHFYNYWADILRLKERPSRDIFFEPYMAWVKESLADNMPYDKWVYTLLTANGRVAENPATGFQLRDAGMPLSYVDNTVRVFLGTQIGCAQCHDHPFDRWTQQEFYKLAALTNGSKFSAKQVLFGGMGGASFGTDDSFSDSGPASDSPFKDEDDLIPNLARLRYGMQTAIDEKKVGGGIRNFYGSGTMMISSMDDEFRLPHDYQYDDGDPLDVVEPAVLWGKIPEYAEDEDNRARFAAWLTTSDNRQFARNIANRMWKKVMGVGLVEPIDDFQEGNIPAIPELLEHLTDEMLRLNFDLREFVRLLVSTETYQNVAVIYDPTAAEPHRYAGPALKRMTAEQLWDSLLTLIAANEWAYQRPTAQDLQAVYGIDMSVMDYEEFEQSYKDYNEYMRGLNRTRNKNCGYEGLTLVRASELPQPSGASHLLRQFGQGDRETIETARQSATVPQILTLFNGWMTHAMLAKGSVIYDSVSQQNTMKSAVDTIFLAILTHEPDADMRRAAEQEIKQASNPAAGCGNLIWALLNTREFLFID